MRNLFSSTMLDVKAIVDWLLPKFYNSCASQQGEGAEQERSVRKEGVRAPGARPAAVKAGVIWACCEGAGVMAQGKCRGSTVLHIVDWGRNRLA